MGSFDWESFLRRWSQAVLESMNEHQIAQLPQDAIESGWLGYPGATEEQICQTESRLGVKFPPSYREFLQVTNGWRQTTSFIRKLWSTEGIERFAARHPKWIESFTNHHENADVSFEHAIELEQLWEPPTVADEEYLIYGEEQDCSKLRVEYLKTAIEISDVGEDSIYLLNPQVVTEDGEWEAWFFGDWLPGADRYPSFREMMEAEYHNFLELRDSASARGESFTESELPEIPETVAVSGVLSLSELEAEAFTQETSNAPPEPTPEEQPEVWRSRKRLIVEFQTRQVGERLEHRTVTAAEGEEGNSWAGLGQHKLRHWLQTQLARESLIHPIDPVIAPVSKQIAPTPELSVPATERSEKALDLALEIDQLAIRQDSRFSAHIVVSPAALKQAKSTGYASLTSQQPFSLEVVFNLVGQSISDLPPQSVTYQAQFHVQSRTTGQWIALGETSPNTLVSHQQIYTVHLFGNTLEPGMYRLKVLTTLRGAAVALTSFELPLLNVV